MRREADVKKEVKRILNKLGIWYFMPVPTGYGVQGIPDFICAAEGVFIAIETKYGSNKPTKWQQIRLTEIADAGGFAWVIDETNIGDLEKRLTIVRDMHGLVL